MSIAAHLIKRTTSKVLGNSTRYQLLYGKTLGYKQMNMFGCLVVCVVLLMSLLINIRLVLEPYHVFSLVIHPTLKDINFTISIITLTSQVEMSHFLNIFFPSKPIRPTQMKTSVVPPQPNIYLTYTSHPIPFKTMIIMIHLIILMMYHPQTMIFKMSIFNLEEPLDLTYHLSYQDTTFVILNNPFKLYHLRPCIHFLQRLHLQCECHILAIFYHQDFHFHDWRQAMADEELAILEANNTWFIQVMPPGKNIVGCR